MSRSNVLPLFPAPAMPPPPPAGAAVRAAADDVAAIFACWQQVMGHGRARLDAVRQRCIRARLADGYSADDLMLAIYGCRLSAWHQGDNDRGEVYDAITLILRDAEHVDKFVALAERGAEAMRQRAERAQQAQTPAADAERSPANPNYRQFLDDAVRMGLRLRRTR